MPRKPPAPASNRRYVPPNERADAIDIEVTRRTWDPIAKRAGHPPLTDEDAREIFETISGVPRLLASLRLRSEPDPERPGHVRFVKREPPVDTNDE